jgi:hypothetical protein
MVVLQAEDRQFGLVVDGINDTQEIVVKPLGKQLKGLTVYAGATSWAMAGWRSFSTCSASASVPGCTGRIARAGARDGETEGAIGDLSSSGCSCSGPVPSIAWPFRSLSLPGWRSFRAKSIEHAGGCQVVQYRNRILPWCLSGPCWNPDAPGQDQTPDPVQVVVFNDGEPQCGFGGGPDPGCRRRGSDGAAEVQPQRTARLGGGGQASHGFPGSEPGHSRRHGELVPGHGRVRERQKDPGRGSLGVLARPDPQRPGHGGLPGAGGRESGRSDS